MPPDTLTRILLAYPLVHQACRRRDAGTAAGRRVSTHQASVLAHLDRRDGITPTALAAALGVALPTVSLLADRLVRAGLIRRDRDPDDRRRVLLRLTAAGERVRSGYSLLDPDRVRALLGVMTPAEQTAGVEGLTALAEATRRLVAGRAPEADRPFGGSS